MLTFTLDSELEKRLEALEITTDDAKAAFVREALLEALEDAEDVKLAEECLARPERSWALEEVERRLDLAEPAAQP